jgi:ligand-binding SRPBCC domain-containing protein
MPLIKLETTINAAIEVCFDLSRSIDLHKISTAKTNETAIDGITKGLINYNESVTWQAKHFGIRQKLTSKIAAYNRPFHFCDEQIKGAFKKIKHDHYFVEKDNMVLMTDDFLFESPFGIAGHVFNKLFLTQYLKRFLIERNQIIKDYAETGKWKQLLL